MKLAYGYIRVSTKQQAGEDRMGPEAQRAAIVDYAERNGFTIVKWFEDEISGVKEDRPKLNEILFTDLPARDGVEAVIAYKSDRIARDIKLYFYYLFVLERKRIKLISVLENFDNDESGLSTVFRALMLFVAEQERNNITMRTKSGRKVKAQQGGFCGGKAPYGYKVVDHQLVIDAKEAWNVRRIFELRERGVSMRAIASVLNNDGARTRAGKWFVASTIQSVLENEKTYLGYYKYGKNAEWVTGQHKPILQSPPAIDHVVCKRGRRKKSEVVADIPQETEQPIPDLEETVEPPAPVKEEPKRPSPFTGGVFRA